MTMTKTVKFEEYERMKNALIRNEKESEEQAQRTTLDYYLEAGDGYAYFKNQDGKVSLFAKRKGMPKKAEENQFLRFKKFMEK